MQRTNQTTVSYVTGGGIGVRREIRDGVYRPADNALAQALDRRRGVLFSSSFEFPGRYTRWDMGFVDPPLCFTARGRRFSIDALNRRGQVLLPAIADCLSRLPTAGLDQTGDDRLVGEVALTTERFSEEMRSRQPSVFSVLRALVALFASPQDQHLGFYGAFGYDLVFQFEPMRLTLPRPEDQRDLVLYLPDEILVVDHMRQSAATHRYEFECGGGSTAGLPRATSEAPYRLERTPGGSPERERPRLRANMPRWSSAPGRPLSAATCSRWSSGSCSPHLAPTRRASSFSGCARPTRRPTAP